MYQNLEMDFLNILDNSSQKMTPFLKMFQEQQTKMKETSSCGARSPPPFYIRFYLSMSQKSVSAHDELRDTFGDAIKLLSRRTL